MNHNLFTRVAGPVISAGLVAIAACPAEADPAKKQQQILYGSVGGGATLNGKPMRASPATRLTEGSVGTGLSNRVDWQPIVAFIADLMANGGVFFRNASGAIMLAYVASGRLLGYVEQHMNAWDCAAGLLMVREAGGRVHRVLRGAGRAGRLPAQRVRHGQRRLLPAARPSGLVRRHRGRGRLNQDAARVRQHHAHAPNSVG